MQDTRYDYRAMHDVATAIAQCGNTATELRGRAESNEASMMAHFTGAASETARTSLATYKQAQDQIIEIIGRGAKNYTTGTEAMAATELQQSAAFPG